MRTDLPAYRPTSHLSHRPKGEIRPWFAPQLPIDGVATHRTSKRIDARIPYDLPRLSAVARGVNFEAAAPVSKVSGAAGLVRSPEFHAC
jgi:hypothetical protein